MSWKTIELRNLCKVFQDGDWIESKDQSPSGIRLIQTGNVGVGYFRDKSANARYISADTFIRLNCNEIFPGDCLVSRLPDPVGRACLLPDLGSRMITAVDCTILRFDETKINPLFFKYYTQSNKYLCDVDKNTTGTTRKRISKNNLSKIKIPVPPLPEQQRIVGILDQSFAAIDQAIENTEKNILNVDELHFSYLQSKFDFSHKDWKEITLSDEKYIKIIDGDRGNNYPKKDEFFSSEYCLFLNTKNVRPDGFNFDSTMFINKEKDHKLGKGKLCRNDIVLTTRGTIGNVGIYDTSVKYDQIRINSGMLIFRPNLEKIYPYYLFQIIQSNIFKSQIAKHKTGAAQPQLPIKTLRNFKFPLPHSIETQKMIVEELRSLYLNKLDLKMTYRIKLNRLHELKQSILHKAFNGEL